ncbi:MAG: YeeE/YedE thiosulfate transporter family protein [Rubrivivax sp.]|nr:YeeE/YedE thiosulfate transporter family protein [Rubrivivax sp.]
MVTHPAASALAVVCAALIGFAAHRASLCNVRAVVEIMSSGSAHMLGSLLQATLWMAALTGVLVFGLGWLPPPVVMAVPAGWALAGGWLFGAGAALNGGCSLSTLHRLADGELGMLATLAGFVLALAAWAVAVNSSARLTLLPLAQVWQRWPALAPWLLAALALWVLQRLYTFGRLARQPPRVAMHQRLHAPVYHLSVAAAVMGLAAGLLYATQGAWSYTNHLRISVLHAVGHPGAALAPSAWHSGLVLALVAGMLASALQRGSLVWRRPERGSTWLRHAGGGALMGAGAALVPGGNDTILLNQLPTLTLQAAATYLVMLAGIASVLWLARLARWPMPAMACTPAGCNEAQIQTPQPLRQGDHP